MFHKLTMRSNQGFTLIEALVTIAILGISAAIAAPSLATWLDNKKVDYALAQIEGAIKEAQSTSVRSNKPCKIVLEGSSVTVAPEEDAPAPAPAGTKINYNFCLPTGSRNIQDKVLGIANGNLDATKPTNTMITFTPRGTTPITTTDSVVVVHRTNGTNNYMKCLIISSGVGMIRTGKYEDTSPPTFSDPPTPTQINQATSKCKTK
jgi:prepilin-type N-terminal cleavage/methylation domain-containing protein